MSSIPEDEEAEAQAELAARKKTGRRSILGWGASAGLALGKRGKIELPRDPFRGEPTPREAAHGIGIFLIVIAILTLLWNLGDGYRGIASHWWPTATATVTNARGWPRSSGGRGHHTNYVPRISVAFTADGADRKGIILLDDQLFEVKEVASDYAEWTYPIGSSVQVHYQPSHPENVRFAPGMDSLTELGLWVGGLMLVVGVVMYRTTRKSGDDPPPSEPAA